MGKKLKFWSNSGQHKDPKCVFGAFLEFLDHPHDTLTTFVVVKNGGFLSNERLPSGKI